MKKLSLGVIVAAGLVTGACESTKNPYDPQKPLDKMTTEEWCNYTAFFLTNPNLSEQTRRIATDKMRARGCQKQG